METPVGNSRLTDKANVHHRRDDSNRARLLLLGLATYASAPAEDQAVHAVRADGEDDHAHVAARDVGHAGGGREADGGNDLGAGDVPGALVEFARGPGEGNGRHAGDEVGWASKDQSDGFAEAEGFYDRGELDGRIGVSVCLRKER